MSKYQETLNFIENVVIDELSNGYDEPRYFRDFHPGVIRAMQELVDKEIPRKPKIFDSVPRARCNVCNNGIRTYSDSNQIKYCHWCGQKIDWS